jgi:cholest-4-en-3-one 26-monooxygenase
MMTDHDDTHPPAPAGQSADDAPEIDLSDPAAYVAGVPHSRFRWLREHDPVHWQPETGRSGSLPGPGYWALTRYADVAFVSKNPDLFSSQIGTCVVSDLPPRDLANMQQQLINMDPPRHTGLRNLMNPHFKPGAVKQMEAQMRRIVSETLDALEGRDRCDFVEDVSAPISLRGLTHLLGVPDKDSKRFYHWTNKLIGATDPEVSSRWRGRLAVLEIFWYAARARRKRMRRPTEDIYSSLIHGRLAGTSLTKLQLGMNYFLLIVAGNETTRNAMSGGIQALCDHPEQLDRLLRAPDLLPAAIEEILRWVSPVMQFRRTALRDLELGGQTIREGDKLVMYYGAANRDPSVFSDPEVFDIARRPNPHLAFGTGTHFCVGSHLARLELRIAFEEILGRYPRLRVDGPIERLQSNFISGIKSMPIALG